MRVFEICVLVVNDLGQEVVEERTKDPTSLRKRSSSSMVALSWSSRRCAVTIIEAVGSALEGRCACHVPFR